MESNPLQLFRIEKIMQENQKRKISGIEGAADLGLKAMNLSMSKSEQDKLMKYGQRWSCINEVFLGNNTAIAKVHLPSKYESDTKYYMLHPALLDCAVSYLRAFYASGVYIPLSYGSIEQHVKLPSEFYSHIKLSSDNTSTKGNVSFEIDLLSTEGN